MRQRLLVVDDEPMIQELLAEALDSFGYDVTVAGNGAQALAALDGFVFDLALLDLFLPDMSGLALIEEICRSRPLTKTVLITGESTNAGVQLARELGAKVLDKPFGLDALRALIESALAQAGEN